MELNYEIYAVDPNNRETRALIGKCLIKGLAKSWAEETITIDDMLVISKSTNEQWYYNKKERRWE